MRRIRFGKIKNKEDDSDAVETTGIFGIGMKRSLFKIGNYFEIESVTTQSKFTLKVNVAEWMADGDNWDFELDSFDEETHTSEEVGTKIIIRELRQEISSEFEKMDFQKELIKHIERRLGAKFLRALK